MKRAKTKGPSPTEAPSAQLSVKVSIDDDGSGDSVYSNFAEVARSQYEIELRFARVPAKFSPDQMATVKDGEALSLYPSVKVILPFAVAIGLVKAIQKQLALGENINDQ